MLFKQGQQLSLWNGKSDAKLKPSGSCAQPEIKCTNLGQVRKLVSSKASVLSIAGSGVASYLLYIINVRPGRAMLAHVRQTAVFLIRRLGNRTVLTL